MASRDTKTDIFQEGSAGYTHSYGKNPCYTGLLQSRVALELQWNIVTRVVLKRVMIYHSL
jgi:hypothetical protein